jgi:DNA-binding NarL/FixJ family response regulator
MISHDLAGRRILLVEDEMLVSMALESTLQDSGATVIGPLARVKQALEAARREQIDAAVLDINLAGEKVFPVADLLAERGIPFVFYTGYSQDTLPPSHRSRPILSKTSNMSTVLNQVGRLVSSL